MALRVQSLRTPCSHALPAPIAIPAPTVPRLLILILASTLVALLLAEIGLRLMGQSYYWAYAKRADPVLGWRPPAYSQGWQRFEGAGLVSTNALGFRDRDHALAKPEGVLRIAVLGDSFTEAVQVPVDQTWWRLMAKTLNDAGCAKGLADPRAAAKSAPNTQSARLIHPDIEVLNFAVSGYSTAQSLLAWRSLAQAFAPDIAVLAFFIGNDINENQRALDNQPLRPYFAVQGNGIALDDRFLRSADYRSARSATGRLSQWLREHSRIVQLALQARDALRMASLAGPRDSAQAERAEVVGAREAPVPQELGVNNAVYLEPQTKDWRQAWQATAAMLGQFSVETRAAGTEPVLMIIGTGTQVHPNATARARFAAALGVEDLGYPVRRLLKIAADHQLPVINLPALWTTDPSDQRPLLHGFDGGRPGFGHWNEAGHRAAADAAATLVCRIMQPSPSMRLPAPASRPEP